MAAETWKTNMDIEWAFSEQLYMKTSAYILRGVKKFVPFLEGYEIKATMSAYFGQKNYPSFFCTWSIPLLTVNNLTKFDKNSMCRFWDIAKSLIGFLHLLSASIRFSFNFLWIALCRKTDGFYCIYSLHHL